MKGLKQLEQRLAQMSRPSKSVIRGSLYQGAERIAGLARNLVPVEEGDLKDSIRTEQGRHELVVDVKAGGPLTQRPVREGVTAPLFDYAGKIETESPFFFASYRALKKSVQRQISKVIRQAAALDAKR